MKLYIKERIKEFQTIVELISNLTMETDFLFNKEGMKINAIHQSGICMLSITIKKEFFDTYINTEENILTLDTVLFKKIIKKVGTNGLTIELGEDNLKFSDKYNSFELKYFVGQKDEREMPQNTYTTKLQTKSSDFFSNIIEAKEFSEIVRLEYNNGFKIKSKGNLIIGESAIESFNYDGVNEGCWYAIDYLSLFKPLSNISKTLDIKFGNNLPVELNIESENVKIKGILAPRVGDEI